MKNMMTAVVVTAVIVAQGVAAEKPTPGYNNKIPEAILTPHDLETRIGTFKYFDGIPTPETAEALYNHLDYIRGVEAFLNGMPAASLEAIRRSQVVQGSVNSYQVRIVDQLTSVSARSHRRASPPSTSRSSSYGRAPGLSTSRRYRPGGTSERTYAPRPFVRAVTGGNGRRPSSSLGRSVTRAPDTGSCVPARTVPSIRPHA